MRAQPPRLSHGLPMTIFIANRTRTEPELGIFNEPEPNPNLDFSKLTEFELKPNLKYRSELALYIKYYNDKMNSTVTKNKYTKLIKKLYYRSI